MRNAKARRKSSELQPAWKEVCANALMGGTSRACAVTLLCPITLVKTRMEASGAAAAAFAYRSVPHALCSITQTEGVRALWGGLFPALAANVPFSTLHYVFYRQFQTMLAGRLGEGAALNFGSGAGASILATVITQPFDVLRTRAMLNLPLLSTSGACFSCPTSSVQQHFNLLLWTPLVAPSGLFAGIGPRLAKRSLQTATLWTLYEELWTLYQKVYASRGRT